MRNLILKATNRRGQEIGRDQWLHMASRDSGGRLHWCWGHPDEETSQRVSKDEVDIILAEMVERSLNRDWLFEVKEIS